MPENSGRNGNSNPDLCDIVAVLRQLNYPASWELVVMWVDYKPVDVETTVVQEFFLYLKCGLE